MKGAFVVSGEEGLYAQIERILVARGGQAGEDVVQVVDEHGPLFTVFGALGPAFEADLTIETTMEATETRGDEPPVPTLSASCWVECRSEEAFVRWVRVIADARTEPTWVLDGDGTLWSSAALDPAGVRL